ncbi:MAG: bifunctional UDP-N-acetylglucosamine diphosphorylase/glucosamine-1-phosphate N-acetyltransferase GlmU [Chloroflexi bacterium]|nr:MAG: bifunctional UDP-N-acetylglucosamine diphosphorylase/glucosamine-1-phosphate N-acetyltransferase GlmU [Chloroflexota bacterium]
MADGPLAVILAAGQGKRMQSATPKVLHPLGGRPLILHILDAARAVTSARPVVVINPGQPQVRSALGDRANVVEQEQPLGTGDALRGLPDAMQTDGPVLVLSGDVPLIRPDTLRRLAASHTAAEGRACTLLSAVPEDPSGMGRVIRDEQGRVLRIVEEGDLPGDAVIPLECNVGAYVFDGKALWPALDRLSADNAQREYYLTSAAETVLRRRTLDALMLGGVTVEDPATTFVDPGVAVGPDSVIRPMSVLRGATTIGAGCVIGPMAWLQDVRGGDRIRIGSSQLEDCVLGDDVQVGPYCRVRPNTVLGSRVELGTHAEVKNSTVGAGTRISHFSCVLDGDVGRDVNIGAGTVTCNFDGRAKHRTTIGDRVFVGTNSTLVAPLRLGEGAYIGAGSFVDMDVPAGALAVGRSRQRNVEGWAARRGAVRA